MDKMRILFDALATGATVITPNNRLSKTLIEQYCAFQSHKTLTKPDCLPYQQWVRSIFQRIIHQYPFDPHPIILSPHQQRYLWETVIRRHQAVHDGLVAQIQSAWQRCHQWLIDMDDVHWQTNATTLYFQRLAQEYQNELTDLNALTEVQIAQYCLPYLDEHHSTPCYWACFDDLTPQQLSLQNTLIELGAVHESFELDNQHASVHYQYKACDKSNELQHVIAWLNQQLNQSAKSIAVVVPDIEQRAPLLERTLQRHLPVNCFNISLGKPLLDYPLMAHALCLLALDGEHYSAEEMNILLYSPYIAHAQKEFDARSLLRQQQALLQEEQLSAAGLLQLLTPRCPELAQRLSLITPQPQHALIETWIDAFKARLHGLGFPGDTPLNSANYQCYQRILGLFDDLLQLSIISPELSHHQVLDALTKLAKTTLFQPKRMPAPIHILGMLEASGCHFDALWIMGLTAQALPQNTQPSAYIPIDLQKKYQMPHASPERELMLANRIFTRFNHSSPIGVYSYPALDGDTPMAASPLLATLPLYAPIDLTSSVMNTQLESYDDVYELPRLNTEPLNGGSRILAEQARCPFKAFADFRLNAQPLPTAREALDQRDKGILIHHIMELFWQEVKTQAALLALDDAHLNELIDTAINKALNPQSPRHKAVPILIKAIETARLKNLVLKSLEWERQRAPFTVSQVEQSFTITLAELDLNIRVDRIDTLDTGQKWVVDYKTTIPKAKPWDEERPQEPQLILYALLDKAINTLLFFEFKKGNIQWQGFSEEEHEMPYIKQVQGKTWSHCRSQWHTQLTQLAQEFQAGLCAPTPHHTQCTYCEYTPLCRTQMNQSIEEV